MQHFNHEARKKGEQRSQNVHYHDKKSFNLLESSSLYA